MSVKFLNRRVVYGFPTSSGDQGHAIVELGSGESRRAVLALLQAAQASLSASLLEHVGEKLLQGEHVSHHPFEGQGFDDLVFMEHLHAAACGIQGQDDVLTDQVRRDIGAFEITADHAMPSALALQMQPISRREPAVRIHWGRQ